MWMVPVQLFVSRMIRLIFVSILESENKGGVVTHRYHRHWHQTCRSHKGYLVGIDGGPRSGKSLDMTFGNKNVLGSFLILLRMQK
jgi:hypothetical protein